jgi:glucose/arabinose dehydrogenase
MTSRNRAWAAVTTLAVAPAIAAAGCSGNDGDQTAAGRAGAPQQTAVPAPRTTPRAAAGADSRGTRRLARSRGAARVSTIATGLDIPWDIAFLPNGSALVTERPGRVRLLTRERRLRREPLARVRVSAQGEGGLLGVAIDPRYGDGNDFVYLYLTTESGMKVDRYRLQRTRLRRDATILDGIEAGTIHDSGRIHFGPDGRLYVSTGDAGRPELAQDPGSLNGKYLRLDSRQYRGDGGTPEVFSLGHRNAQGFDWQPRTGRLISTEHGPDGDDEVNLVSRGANYGWPRVRGRAHRGFRAPLLVYPTSIAPSGATFVTLPGSSWSGDYLFAALRGEHLRRLRLDGRRITRNSTLFAGRFGRLRTVVEAPDGSLFVLTSNRDGRGSPRSSDDRILRIVPPASR